MFDTHAHLQMIEEKTEHILSRAQEQGIRAIINVSTGIDDTRVSLDLAKKFPMVYATVGVHPHDAEKLYNDVSFLKEMEYMITQDKVVALGEIGLDYYKNKISHAVQKQVFEWQIRIALENEKPIIVHNREADEDVYEILKYYKCKDVVFHCYGRDKDFTRKILDMGWLVSFTGNITFPKNLQGQEAVRFVPLDKMMLETDCPFMAPVPHRGKICEPAHVRLVAEKIAELKDESLEQVEKITDRTAKRFFNFNLPEDI